MHFSLFKVTLLLAAACAVVAQTPPNFVPSTTNNLQVKFGGLDVLPGRIEPQKSLSEAPDLALRSPEAPLYIAFMMDISVVLKPGAFPTTLIHWVRPYLQPENGSFKPTSIAPLVPYMPPGPPPGQTHNYIVLLFEQPSNFKVPESYTPYFSNITASVNNRIGFNLTEFTDATELKQPVAANWFRVSTPVQSTSTASASPAGTRTTRSQATVSTSSASKVLAIMGRMGLVGLAMTLIGLNDYEPMF
ncbi:hypothetical protein FNYG_00132 [Fusarium nygamai]|uniref:PEBP-like protein n=1 Tax=Gibberella nygamai TaxID=42673 RepID=A0A2K0WVX3_GIBNY|nr:hypothetical protein FNYG_00132 [Fusarium nygamai]